MLVQTKCVSVPLWIRHAIFITTGSLEFTLAVPLRISLFVYCNVKLYSAVSASIHPNSWCFFPYQEYLHVPIRCKNKHRGLLYSAPLLYADSISAWFNQGFSHVFVVYSKPIEIVWCYHLSFYLSHYPIRVMNPVIIAISKWKYLLLLKLKWHLNQLIQPH